MTNCHKATASSLRRSRQTRESHWANPCQRCRPVRDPSRRMGPRVELESVQSGFDDFLSWWLWCALQTPPRLTSGGCVDLGYKACLNPVHFQPFLKLWPISSRRWSAGYFIWRPNLVPKISWCDFCSEINDDDADSISQNQVTILFEIVYFRFNKNFLINMTL